jgi:hypothetical protein
LLLAHHKDGVLTFSGTGESVGFTQFERKLGHGSIAVSPNSRAPVRPQSFRPVGQARRTRLSDSFPAYPRHRCRRG